MGKRIKEVRELRGMTQSELAAAACALAEDEGAVSQQGLGLLENRDSMASAAAPFIAEALRVNLRWLLTGKGLRDQLDWPFNLVRQSRWDACGEGERGYVQGVMNRALDDCEVSRGKVVNA